MQERQSGIVENPLYLQVERLRAHVQQLVERLEEELPELNVCAKDESCLQGELPTDEKALRRLDEELLDLKVFCEHYLKYPDEDVDIAAAE